MRSGSPRSSRSARGPGGRTRPSPRGRTPPRRAGWPRAVPARPFQPASSISRNRSSARRSRSRMSSIVTGPPSAASRLRRWRRSRLRRAPLRRPSRYVGSGRRRRTGRSWCCRSTRGRDVRSAEEPRLERGANGARPGQALEDEPARALVAQHVERRRPRSDGVAGGEQRGVEERLGVAPGAVGGDRDATVAGVRPHRQGELSAPPSPKTASRRSRSPPGRCRAAGIAMSGWKNALGSMAVAASSVQASCTSPASSRIVRSAP